MIPLDVVLVPVEVPFVGEVTQLLNRLRDVRPVEASVSGGGEDDERVYVEGNGDWTRDMVVLLKDRLAYKGVVALLDACAAQPGTWVPKSVVESQTGLSPIEMRNQLGAFSKLTRRIFKTEPIWPINYRKEAGVYSYRMPARIAEWWLEAERAES